MTCTGRHTKYQPKMPEDWKCPKCGAESEYRDARGQVQDGWIIQDVAEDAADDCELNHAADNIGCGRCGYGCSGATFARQLQKKHNLVPCEHCKGRGLVSAVKT